MKKKSAMFLLWLLLLQSAMVIPAFSAGWPAGWKALKTDLHINEKTLTRINSNTVSAWIYLFPKKGSDAFAAAGQKLKTMKKGSNDLEYIGYHSEINCGKSMYRNLTTIFFSDDRNIIASHHRSQAEWKEIENQSVFQELYQSVCEKDITALRSASNED